MADELKIRIDITGIADFDELVKKFNEGNITLNEMAKLKKGVNSAFKEFDPVAEAGKYKGYANALAVINDRQRDVRIQTRAGHEAYFKAGLELRQLTLAGIGADTMLGKLSTTLGNSVMNAVQLRRMLVPLGVSLSGVGIAAVAVIAALPVLISLFSKSAEAAKKAKEAHEEWRKSLSELSASQLANEIEYLKERIKFNQMEQEIAEEMMGRNLFEGTKALDEAKKRRGKLGKDLIELQKNLIDKQSQLLKTGKEEELRIITETERKRIELTTEGIKQRLALLDFDEKTAIEALKRKWTGTEQIVKAGEALILETQKKFAQERLVILKLSEQQLNNELLRIQSENEKSRIELTSSGVTQRLLLLEQEEQAVLAGLRKKYANVEGIEKAITEMQTAYALKRAKITQDIEMTAWLAKPEVFRPEPYGKKEITFPSAPYVKPPPIFPKDTKATLAETLEPLKLELAKQHSKEFVQDLYAGITSATGQLSAGFVKAFGLGNDLASQMLATLIAAASQALIILGLKKVGMAIGGPFGWLLSGGVTKGARGLDITEPTLGFGLRTGRRILIGEAGPERVSPMYASALGQQPIMINPSVTVHPIISNAGLAVQVEIGNRSNKRIRH